MLEAALVASLRDETPEGRSIVTLARQRLAELGHPAGDGDDAGLAALDARIAEVRDFSAETRTSGVTLSDGITVLKGAVDAIAAGRPGGLPAEVSAETTAIAGRGATPLALSRDGHDPRAASSSRTRSSPASPSASRSSAGWASGRS